MCPTSKTFGPAAFLWADLGRPVRSSVTVPMASTTWLALLAALAQYPWSWAPATLTLQLCSVPAASVRALWGSAAQATPAEDGQNCAGYLELPLSKRPSDGSSRRSFSDSTMQVRMTSASAAWGEGEGDEKSEWHVGISTAHGPNDFFSPPKNEPNSGRALNSKPLAGNMPLHVNQTGPCPAYRHLQCVISIDSQTDAHTKLRNTPRRARTETPGMNWGSPFVGPFNKGAVRSYHNGDPNPNPEFREATHFPQARIRFKTS